MKFLSKLGNTVRNVYETNVCIFFPTRGGELTAEFLIITARIFRRLRETVKLTARTEFPRARKLSRVPRNDLRLPNYLHLQYLLALSYLYSAGHENPLYVPVVCVQMFTGLRQRGRSRAKNRNAKQNTAVARNCVSRVAFKSTRIPII